MRIQLKSLLIIVSLLLGFQSAHGSEAPIPPKQKWAYKLSEGRTFDRAALQRGYQVYKQVCAVCHGMDHLAYRNLKALGFKEEEIKAIAAEYKLKDGPNDEGEMFERTALPEDRFVNPYANEKMARAANNGAFPPDLSLIIKARAYGPDYVYGLLTGYRPKPEGLNMPDTMHYNLYFPGHQIAMIPPLTEGQVSFSDGTVATVEQMAKDVVTFLAWAAEPEMEQRHQMGIMVMIFTTIFTMLMYFVMRRVWKDVK